MIHSGIQSSCRQVVGHGYGVNVPSQVKVEILHRYDLAVPTPGSTTLDVESWAHARLPDTGDNALLKLAANGLN